MTDLNDPTAPPLAEPGLPAPKIHGPLGAQAASGFAWNLAATFSMKLLGLISQIVLARLLFPEQFGAFAQAMIIVNFASLIRDSALPQVLVHRQKQLNQLANTAFWLSLLLGVFAGLIMAASAFYFYARPGGGTVAGLLIVSAVGSPLMAIGVVPAAMLQAQLRFKLLAQVGVWTSIAATLLTMFLAWMNWGAYSLLVPQVVISAVRSIIMLLIARPSIRHNLEADKWPSIAYDGGMTLATSLGWLIVGQGDYMTLSWFFDKGQVGIYYFAFNLSLQALVLMTMNLASVLLPTLARLNEERPRQVAAFLRACRLLAAVGVPICILQILLGRPAVLTIFGAKWTEAVPLVQILSFGMAFAMVTTFSVSMMQAQGRFRTLAIWTAIQTITFLVLVQIGARQAGLPGTAVAVSFYYLVFGLIGMRIALADAGSWMDLARIFVPTFLACAVAGTVIGVAAMLTPSLMAGIGSILSILLFLCVCTAGFTAIYAIVLRFSARAVFDEIAGWFGKALSRWHRQE